jgi:hypothetical protein
MTNERLSALHEGPQSRRGVELSRWRCTEVVSTVCVSLRCNDSGANGMVLRNTGHPRASSARRTQNRHTEGVVEGRFGSFRGHIDRGQFNLVDPACHDLPGAKGGSARNATRLNSTGTLYLTHLICLLALLCNSLLPDFAFTLIESVAFARTYTLSLIPTIT